MSKRKKNMINGAFLLIVFLLTIYSVFKGEDLSDIAETITEAKTFYLIMGVACVVFFIWAESTILHYLFGTLHIKTKRRTCFMYSSVGFFFSCITPSAGGGQPAQVYYMRRNMIPVPVATVVLMVVTITYKLVLVITGCLLVLFGRGLLNRYVCEAMPVFYLGLTLNVVFCLAMLILAFHTSLAKNIVMKLLGFLVRLHILKDKTSRTERLNMTMDHYNDTSAYLRQHKEVLIRVMFLTFCQRTALFSVTYFVYKAFGLTGTHMAALILLQSAISISADMLPLPGGMGISEHLFLTIFDPIFYGDLLLPAMVLSRGIAYYVQLVFSAAVTLIAHILIDKRQRRA
ncbi:lysylphosphatidylglycerol synthase transmembrane domain-containing protein [Enterocloster citroniae]|uniref:lysylphosphatidylglycerol synthase transmembrane domain-containing protein n=1 Tax=Enterocloster citroniae TaxID=358743 RepID=UPI0008E351FE|nr:lysylphosphatidylglycerol synthase transmembrane domain-containing protein [Enterocloster citroniae]SFS22504.1 hypothetical protein SAMN05216568_108229 [Enterocloster citroniae]